MVDQRIRALTPFVKVMDVERSVAFYRLLGMHVRDTFEPHGVLAWAHLECNEAHLMVERGHHPDPEGQGVQFYLFADNLAALREQLVSNGVEPGPIEDGAPGPSQEMRLIDPDGYCLMVAQIEP